MINPLVSIARRLQGVRTPVFSTWGRIYLRALGVKYGRGLSASSSFLCRRHGTGILTIGHNLRLTNRSTENRAGINHKCILIVEDGASMTIGNFVGMSGATLYCSIGIHIEDYVNIGANVTLFDTDFHPIGWRERRAHDRGAVKRKPIFIRQDA
jgi:acetyltransferase-like isoleucine patch superfamily enzyme